MGKSELKSNCEMKLQWTYFKIVIFTILICLLTACEDPRTAKLPAIADIAGEYQLKGTNFVEVITKSNYAVASTKLFLVEDGTLRVRDIPDCWIDLRHRGGLISGSGKWFVKQQGKYCRLDFDFDDLGEKKRFAHSAELLGQKVPYSIWFQIGDPDVPANGLRFEKKSE